MTFGTFIEPDSELETLKDPNDKLNIPVYSGYRAFSHGHSFAGRNKIFDDIHRRTRKFKVAYEDQCSIKYYFDLVSTMRDFAGEYDRVVEVGVYMGGSSSIFGGCIDRFDFDLDLVDISADFLRYSYERIRRLFPESAHRVRMFHGDLPTYVDRVMRGEARKTIVHHDGAHDFNQVVKDFASLSYVQDQLRAIICQDTHLRGTIDSMNFVDMALYAVFGLDLNYAPIGAAYEAADPRTAPNRWQGNYFAPGASEGFVLPMDANSFHYPHPDLTLEALLPKAA